MTKSLSISNRRHSRRHAATILIFAVATIFISLPVAAETLYFDFANDGLENLGPGWVYEGWVIVDGSPVSTGVFSVDMTGMAHPSRFAVDVDDAAAASTFVLTIEPVPDMDPGPSSVHVLAGEFSANVAELSSGHPAALGDDFSSASATYILNAPSGGESADYFNGIWWLDPAAGPGVSASLPQLPAGWAYEGWVAGPEGAISTGRFLDASAVDSDGQGITGGPYAAPPFPGQDFVVPPVDLTSGFAAVLSIEPSPDNSPAPFAFKPLVDGDIEALGAGMPQMMDNNAAAFPMASVLMSRVADGMQTAHLMLDIDGLEDLGAEAAYEGWLIVDGAPVSTGTFTVNGGVQSMTYFPTAVSSLDSIAAFVLTIEPVPDADPLPSAIHLLGGDVIGGRAALTIDHDAALGTDFSSAAGSYILNAPSSGGSVPYSHGIWWLDPEAGPGATLELPMLPEGWQYEGWVASAAGPVSTGRFTMAEGADSDGQGATGGPEAFPPFPGQDFVTPATDLTSGFAAVISVEPNPDNSAAPFTLKPLMDPFIDDVGAGILQPMHSNLSSIPSGTAMLAQADMVPAAASVTGVGGARWFTDLFVTNDTTEMATIMVQLLRTNQSNQTPKSITFNIPAGGAMRYEDVLAELFDFVGTGSLRILSTSSGVRSSSRTYAATDDGSYGQGIPAFMDTQSLSYGQAGRLLQLSEGGAFRTNIGFVNAGSEAVMVHLELFDNDGVLISTRMVTLEAAEHQQLNGVYPESVDVGWARVWTSTPGGRFFAYASVVDNGVDDPTFIIAQ